MHQRKSRAPDPPAYSAIETCTQVSPAPSNTDVAPLTNSNVIPFAKPRAISQLIADTKVRRCRSDAVPDGKPSSMGRRPKPQAKNLWARDRDASGTKVIAPRRTRARCPLATARSRSAGELRCKRSVADAAAAVAR